MFLEEGDVADIAARRRPGDRHRRASSSTDAVHEIDWSIEAAEKGGYEHFMLKEMHEQPEAIRAAIAGRLHGDEVRRRASSTGSPTASDRSTASSSSPAAAPPTRPRSGPTRSRPGPGIPARWNIGSEFRYSPPPLDERTLVIAVTQSGETADTIAPTRLARARGLPGHRGHEHGGVGDHPRGRRDACSSRPGPRSPSSRRRRSSPRSRRCCSSRRR